MLAPPPEPPDWTFDWFELIEDHYPWLTEREPFDRLVSSDAFRAFEAGTRTELFTALAFAPLGPSRTREILWEWNMELAARERVVRLVQHREAPWMDLTAATPRLVRLSWSVRCDHLALLAWAERGSDTGPFRDACREQQCLDGPWPFETAHARFHYFQRGGTNPYYVPHEQFRCEVVVMSGLPGAGKDTWIAENDRGWPIVSLDRIRERRGVRPTDDQGQVIQDAREAAREHLRAPRTFVWNATNVSRRVRRQVISLAADYDARVRIVYVEVDASTLWKRNAQRPDGLPRSAMRKLLIRWDVPELAEAHDLEVVRGDTD